MSELTDQLWERFGALTLAEAPEEVVQVAGHSVLDWFGCALAGSREPLASILRDEFSNNDGVCTLVGSQRRTDPLRAALINGATSHALDFDDTNTAMGGHPTVPLLPAILSLTEEQGRSGADVLTAYVVGMEVQAVVAGAVGHSAYGRGWHTTATSGVFGAAAASSWLLSLDSTQFGHAMGIAASNASGVKANFGTMTKPLHPGQAAERGLMSARLASRGYTSNSDAITGNQGLSQATGTGARSSARPDQVERWATPDTLFKFHAACHLTHAAIEATSSLLTDGASADDIDAISMTVNPSILDVCGIPDPTTGLEAKFSLRGTQALLVHGEDTASISTFEDGPINRPEVQSFIDRVTVDTDESFHTMQARVQLNVGGHVRSAECDVSQPADDLALQGVKLRAKFDALSRGVIGDTADELGDTLERLTEVDDIRDVLALTR